MTSTATGPTDQEPLHCLGCGYDLRGLDESGDCPECGKPIRETINIPDVWITHPGWLNLQIRLLWCWAGLAAFTGIISILENAVYEINMWAHGNYNPSELNFVLPLMGLIGPFAVIPLAVLFRNRPNPHAPADGSENRWRRALPYLALLSFLCNPSISTVLINTTALDAGLWAVDRMLVYQFFGLLSLLCAMGVIACFVFLFARWPRLTKPQAPTSIPGRLFVWTLFMLGLGFLTGNGQNVVLGCAFAILVHDLGWWLKDKQLLRRSAQYFVLMTCIPILVILVFGLLAVLDFSINRRLIFLFVYLVVQIALLAALFFLILRVTMRVRELRRQAVA